MGEIIKMDDNEMFEFRNLPDKIKQLQLDILDKDERLDILEQVMDERYDLIMLEVTNERDETGKEKFGSETKRKVETNFRMKESEDYKNMKTKRDSLKKEISRGKIDVEFWQRRFRMYEVLFNNRDKRTYI